MFLFCLLLLACFLWMPLKIPNRNFLWDQTKEGQSREVADWGASGEAEVAECKRKRGKRRMRRSVNAIKSEIKPNKGKSRGKRGNRSSIKGRQWDEKVCELQVCVYCGSFPLFIWISLSMGSLRTYFFGICSTFICVLQISLKNLVRFEIIDISMNKIIIHIWTFHADI